MSRIKPSNYALITSLKQPKPVRSSELVSRLLANCKKLQSLRNEARQQAQDAQLAYDDLCDQTSKAWDKYYDAKNGEPANSDYATG